MRRVADDEDARVAVHRDVVAAVVAHIQLWVEAVGRAQDVGVRKVLVPAKPAGDKRRRVAEPDNVDVRDEHRAARRVEQIEDRRHLPAAERVEEAGVAADVDGSAAEAPSSQNEPGTHSTHAVAPLAFMNLPASHLAHVPCLS